MRRECRTLLLFGKFDNRLVRVRFVEQNRLSKDRGQPRFAALGQFFGNLVAIEFGAIADSDFDKFVLQQGFFQRAYDSVRDTVFANGDDGVEVMAQTF